MYIFIDESGIHKQTDHSTFAIIYIELNNLSKIEDDITNLEKKLNIKYFHWSETIWKVKERFMDSVLKLDFSVKIAIVNNPINPSKELEKVLLHTVVETNIHTIYIDGKKPKWFELKIKKVLRDKGISVKKLKTVKSSQFAGARLADMVADLVRSYYDNKNVKKITPYYKRLKNKIIITLKQ